MRDASRGRWSAERESSSGGNIGEILVSRGKLSEEQLRVGLEAKRTDPRRIGEILLSLGFISDEDLVDPAALPLLVEKALRKLARCSSPHSEMVA